VIAWGEALIVHRDADVECLAISDYRPYFSGCVQEPPYEVVLTDRFGTGHIEGAVQRLTEGHSGERSPGGPTPGLLSLWPVVLSLSAG
jgi:hypothetical protein